MVFLGNPDFHFQQPSLPRLNNGTFTPSSLAQCLQQCYHDLLAKARQDDVYVEERAVRRVVAAGQHHLYSLVIEQDPTYIHLELDDDR